MTRTRTARFISQGGRAVFSLTLVTLVVSCTAGCQGTASTPRATPSTATDVSSRAITLPGNSFPDAMAAADDGTLWVSEEAVAAIARITPAGIVTQYRIPSDPSGIALGDDGSIWFTASELLGRIPPHGSIQLWQIPADGIVRLPNGIVTSSGSTIDYWTADTDTTMTVPPPLQHARRIQLPPGVRTVDIGSIAPGPGGTIWFTISPDQPDADRIGRIDSNGDATFWPLPNDTSPRNITEGPDNAMWFVGQTSIWRISASGAMSTFQLPAGQLSGTLAAGTGDTIWFTTTNDIGRITTPSKIAFWPIPAAQRLDGIVAAKSGGFWLSDSSASIVYRVAIPN
jgi:streptogramin lyase